MKKLITLISSLIAFGCFGQTVGKYIEYTVADNTTKTVVLSQYNNYIMIKGTAALSTGNFIIDKSGTPVNGMMVNIYWNATTTGAYSVVVFGTTLNKTQTSFKGLIACYYQNSAWTVNFIPNFIGAVVDSSYFATNNFGNGIKKESGITLRVDTTSSLGFKGNAPTKTLHLKYDDTTLTAYGTQKLLRVKASGIDSTRIKAKNVTFSKLPDIPQGSIYVGGTSDRPTYRNAKTNNYILIGDGTDVKSVGVTGAFTINAGITTLTPAGIRNVALDDTVKREVITFPVSFDTLQVPDTIKIMMPYNCKIVRCYYSTIKTIGTASYCAAVLPSVVVYTNYNTGGDFVYSSNVDPSKWALSSTVTSGDLSATPNNVCLKGLPIKIYSNRASPCQTKGGAIMFTINVQRIY